MGGRHLPRLGAAVLFLFALCGLGADLLAGDVPLAARVSGRLLVLPGWTAQGEAARGPLDSWRERVGFQGGDWWLPPLLQVGPGGGQLDEALQPPSRSHWMGTDELGRDVLARLIHGARISLLVALACGVVQWLLGLLLGGLAGAVGGWPGSFLARLTDAVLGIPPLVLVLAVVALARPRSAIAVGLLVGAVRWPEVARLVRAEVERARVSGFAEASRSLGGGRLHVLWRHLWPSAQVPARISLAFGAAGAILTESALGFLGHGVPLGTPTWGELLQQAQRHALAPGAWWLALFPGLALFVTIAALQAVGEGARQQALRAPTGDHRPRWILG